MTRVSRPSPGAFMPILRCCSAPRRPPRSRPAGENEAAIALPAAGSGGIGSGILAKTTGREERIMTRVRKASRRELLSRGGALAALGIAGVLDPRRARAHDMSAREQELYAAAQKEGE